MNPHFLIVGAQKAGTTTLYRDLLRHPDIFMPEDKEPETLVRFKELPAIRRDYASVFPKGATGKIRGEASTAYTKRPLHEGVAERAYALTGGSLRIVYMRRDPFERLISQFKHETQLRKISIPLPEALRQFPELIDYSRYDWQIKPWKDAFGEDSVLEVGLEYYSGNRLHVIKGILEHIGANPERLPDLDTELIENRSTERKYIDSPLLRALILSRFYQRHLKPALPRRWREAGRRKLLSKPLDIDVALSDADREFIKWALAEKR